MFVKSEILRSPHAFATRRGGVSELEHTKELNLAFLRGDDGETVLKNLEIFAKNVGFDPESVVSLPQIHSDIIYKVGKSDRGQGYYCREHMREGDGYITDEKNVVLGVKAADCVPILFEAEKNGEIVAVGAVHAGWRGTVAGIQRKCVSLLCREYDVTPQNIRAAIGPCIHACCYEVGEDLYLSVSRAVGEETANRFLTPVLGKKGKYLCDLVSLNRYMIESAGVPSDNIDAVELCTCCHPELFYSHRYSGGVRGTMLNVIYINR